MTPNHRTVQGAVDARAWVRLRRGLHTVTEDHLQHFIDTAFGSMPDDERRYIFEQSVTVLRGESQ